MGDNQSRLSRRSVFGALGLVLLSRCSSSEPEEAEALQQIAENIRSQFGVGEKQLANLTYKKGIAMDDGRYAITVDYDLISTMPEVGLFNTQTRAGQTNHVTDERYVFARVGSDWKLQP